MRGTWHVVTTSGMGPTVIFSLLLVVLGAVSGSLQDRPLYDDLKNVMPFEPVQYSKPNVSMTYRVTSRFNPRGMGHLYMVTNLFMDYLQRGDPLPKGK